MYSHIPLAPHVLSNMGQLVRLMFLIIFLYGNGKKSLGVFPFRFPRCFLLSFWTGSGKTLAGENVVEELAPRLGGGPLRKS